MYLTIIIHKDNTCLVCGCDDYSVQVMHFDPNTISEFEGGRGDRGGSSGSGIVLYMIIHFDQSYCNDRKGMLTRVGQLLLLYVNGEESF